jgi:hypothetical protein
MNDSENRSFHQNICALQKFTIDMLLNFLTSSGAQDCDQNGMAGGRKKEKVATESLVWRLFTDMRCGASFDAFDAFHMCFIGRGKRNA